MKNDKNKKDTKKFWLIMCVIFIALCIGIMAVLHNAANKRSYDAEPEKAIIIMNIE